MAGMSDAALGKQQQTKTPQRTLGDAVSSQMQQQRVEVEEAGLREKHAARPRSSGLADAVMTMINNPERAKQFSAWDLTIDALGTVTNPINDYIVDPAAEALGFEAPGRMTDTLKDAVRNTEAGFKAEEGIRTAGADIASAPTIPSAVYGLGGAIIESAMSDKTFGEAMLSEDGAELYRLAMDEGDTQAIEQLLSDPNQILRRGLHFTADYYEGAEDFFGVADRKEGPKPVDEEVYGIIMGSFVGIPAGLGRGLTKTLVDKFGTDRAIQYAQRLAANPVTRVTANAAELATPVTFPLTPGRVAANAGVGIGINDAIRAATGEDTAVGQLRDQVARVDSETLATTGGAAGGLAAAVAVGAALTGRSGSLSRNLRNLSGKGPRKPSSVRDIETEMFDSDAPTGQLLDDMSGRNRDVLDEWEDTQRLNTRNGGEARVDTAWEEGVAPGKPGTMYSMPGARVVQQADTLQVNQRKMMREGMDAEDALWAIQAGRGDRTGLGEATLKQRAALLQRNLRQNPQMKKVYDDYHTHTKEVLEQAHDAGYFTAKEMTELRTRKYIPNIPVAADEPTTWYRMLFGGNTEGRFQNQAKNPFMKFRQGQVEEVMDPFESLGTYEKAITNDILLNRTRSKFINLFTQQRRSMGRSAFNELFPDGAPIRRQRKNERASNTVSIWRGGKEITYVVDDPQLRNNLLYAPHSTIQSLSDLRRLQQLGITGELNPFFATRSNMIDTFFSSMMVQPHQVAGVIDNLLHSTGIRQVPGVGTALSAATRPVDAVITSGIGVGRGAYNHIVRELAMQLDGRLGKTSLAGIVPEPLRQRMSVAMTRVFHKSVGQQMQRAGFAPGRFSADLGDMSPGALDNVLHALFRDNFLGRQYRGILNSIRDGYRLEFFAQNRARLIKDGMNEHAATKRAARWAREVGSDPTRAGQNDNLNKINSTIPYANIGFQAAGTVFKAAARDRNMTVPMVMLSHAAYSIGAAGMLFEMGAGEWWFESQPDRVRARGLPINPTYMQMKAEGRGDQYVFDPDDMFVFDVGPEVGMFRAPITAAVETMLGMNETLQWTDPGVQTRYREFGEAVRQMIPWGVPQVGNLLTSMVGLGPVQENRITGNTGIFPQAQRGGGVTQDRRFTGANDNSALGPGGPAIMTDRVADVMNSLAGTFGTWAADLFEQVEATGDLNDGNLETALDTIYDRQRYAADKALSNMLHGYNQTPSRSSPTISKAYDLRRKIKPIEEEVEKALYGVVGQKSDPVDLTQLPMRLPNTIQDPQLRAMAQQFVINWNKHGVIGDTYNNLSDLRVQYEGVEARRDIPRARQEFLMNSLVNRMQQEAEKMMTAYGDIEAGMRAQMGEDFTLDSFLDELTKDARRAQPDVRN